MCSQQVSRDSACGTEHTAEVAELCEVETGPREAKLSLSCCACCADARPDTAPLYTLQLHSLVVASASPGHLRGYCLRAQDAKQDANQQQGVAAEGKGKKRKKAKRRAQGNSVDTDTVGSKRHAPDTADHKRAEQEPAYRLTLFPGEPEDVPKAVLCHLYTGALPKAPVQLIWVSSLRKTGHQCQ